MKRTVRPAFLAVAVTGGAVCLALIVLAAERQRPPRPDSPFFHEDTPLSPKKRAPGQGDWLAAHGRNEKPQSFDDYVLSGPPRPTSTRKVFVIQPLGDFSPADMDVLKAVGEYCGIFFALPVRVEQPIPLPSEGRRQREMGALKFDQYLTSAILDDTLSPMLPEDAACCLGVTMADLYPEPDWNFVFGQADIAARVGVHSLARYRAEFWGQEPGPDPRKLLLLRAVKVMAHEAGHMFGLLHCRDYECVMNGSNNLLELDRQSVFLDPVCLRKLQWNVGFDPADRYRKMERFWLDRGYPEQSGWISKRLENSGERR